MKLKTTEINGVVYAEVQDGKPVYEAEDGKPVAFDAPATRATITRLNEEAKNNRLRYEKAEGDLKAFEGLDSAHARKAIDLVKNYDDKKLIDAGQVDKVKQEAKDAYDRQIEDFKKQFKPVEEERDSLRDQLYQTRLGSAFDRSPYLDKNVRPATSLDLIQARFGRHFNYEDGKLVAKDASGNLIYSRARPGEMADFDEAIAILIDSHPDRDRMLAGSGASGGGAGGSRTGAGGQKQYTRAQFEGLSPAEQAKAAKAMTAGEASIID